MARPKKDARISIKIDKDLYADFQAWCKENQTTVSGQVKQSIKRTLDVDRERKREETERVLRLKALQREQEGK